MFPRYRTRKTMATTCVPQIGARMLSSERQPVIPELAGGRALRLLVIPPSLPLAQVVLTRALLPLSASCSPPDPPELACWNRCREVTDALSRAGGRLCSNNVLPRRLLQTVGRPP